MQPTLILRLLLSVSGLIAFAIGASILLDPVGFHAGYGTDLGSEASLLSEVRAPGGALLVLGALMLVGVVARGFTHASTAIAAAVYLAYGLSRLVSLGLDGVPAQGLLVATGFELVLGAACVLALVRGRRAGEVA